MAQYGDRQWFRGKSFDTFAPCGPWVVLKEDITDAGNLALSAHWNENKMQEGRTDDLIHDIPNLVSYISRQMTLLPGDLIATGTPAGVGVFRDPPVFLAKGDTVRVRVEGIGELINPCRVTSRAWPGILQARTSPGRMRVEVRTSPR